MTETDKDDLEEGMEENEFVSSTEKGSEDSGFEEVQDGCRCSDAAEEQARADDAKFVGARESGTGEGVRERRKGVQFQENGGRSQGTQELVKLDKHFSDRLRVLLRYRGIAPDEFADVMEDLGWYPVTEMDKWRKVVGQFIVDAAMVLRCEPDWLARHEGNSPWWLE